MPPGTFTNALLDRLSELRVRFTGALLRANPDLPSSVLEEAGATLLDRLLLLRVCEDRGIAPPGTLRRIRDLRDTGDISPDLAIDEAPLRDALEELCPPRLPSGDPPLPAAILGAAYERSLGEAVVLDGEGAKRLPRPGTRRSGGVVYTPGWIVREIVRRTLAPKLEGRSREELLQIRALDPACGAGSFLLGAAEALFEAHLEACRREAPADGSGVFMDSRGALRLTVERRREIVLRCLFGVDKDPRAVEVARRSLGVAILEGALEERMDQNGSSLSQLPLLPDLANNLRCGDSLIAPEDIAPDLGFDEERTRRIRAFAWDDTDHGFGRVAREGGFHAIVGNPPYIRIQETMRSSPDEAAALRRAYPGAADGGFDVYAAFVLRGLGLLREDGTLGFVMPLRWMKAHYGRSMRALVAGNGHLAAVDDFGPEQVFPGVTAYTGLQLFTRRRSEEIRYRRIAGGSEPTGLGRILAEHRIPARDLGGEPWYLGQPPLLRGLFERLLAESLLLESAVSRIAQGIKTGCDGVFVLHEVERDGERLSGRSKASGERVEIESAACKWLVKGGEMQRHRLLPPGRAVIFPYEIGPDERASLLPFSELRARFPRTARYLSEHRPSLAARERGRFSAGPDWHCYSRHQNLDLPGQRKIVVADVLNRARFAYDHEGSACFLGGAAGGYGLVVRPPHDPFAVTAALNSALCEWMLRPPGLSDWFAGGWFSGEARFIRKLPVVPESAREASKLGLLGRELHALAADLPGKKADRDGTSRLVADREAQVDALVFDAFGVSRAERTAILGLVAELHREYGRPRGG